METQTWLSHHYNFISAENITLLSVSSDDFLHVCMYICVCVNRKWHYITHKC